MSTSKIECINDITNIFYINLQHRTDRKTHVEQQLSLIGLNGQRFNAIKMDNGAIGCSMSHLKLLQDAVKNELDHILIIEDDIEFLDSELFKSQLNKFFEIHGNEWDVVMFAGNNVPPYKRTDDTCIQVSNCLTTTGYLVNGHYIKILAQNVKMGLTHLINKPSEHTKFAIDKFWSVLQSSGKWFLITPICVVQREDYSDIEKKHTNYKGLMQDIDKREMIETWNKYKTLHKINKL